MNLIVMSLPEVSKTHKWLEQSLTIKSQPSNISKLRVGILVWKFLEGLGYLWVGVHKGPKVWNRMCSLIGYSVYRFSWELTAVEGVFHFCMQEYTALCCDCVCVTKLLGYVCNQGSILTWEVVSELAVSFDVLCTVRTSVHLTVHVLL